MKAIVLALALLLFTSPVHANSIDGKFLECTPTTNNKTEVAEFWQFDRAYAKRLGYSDEEPLKVPNDMIKGPYIATPDQIQWKVVYAPQLVEFNEKKLVKFIYTLNRENLRLTQLMKIVDLDPWDFSRDSRPSSVNNIVQKVILAMKEELKKFGLQKNNLRGNHVHKETYQCKLANRLKILNELRQDIREIKADMKKKNKL